jgi:hypothetical protein
VEEYERGIIEGKIGRIMEDIAEIRRAEEIAYGRYIIHDLDDLGEGVGIVGRFIEYLEEYRKTGNGQLAMRGEDIDRIIEELGEEGERKYRNFVIGAAREGVEIYERVIGERGRHEGLGLAGYIERIEGKDIVYNERLGTEMRGEEVKDFRGAEELIEKIRRVKGASLVSNASLRETIGEERSALGARGVMDILRGIGIIGILRGREIDEGYIKSVIIEIEMGEEGREERLEKLKERLEREIGKVKEGEKREKLRGMLEEWIEGKKEVWKALREIGKENGLEDGKVEGRLIEMAIEMKKEGKEIKRYGGELEVRELRKRYEGRYMFSGRTAQETLSGVIEEAEELRKEGRVGEGFELLIFIGEERNKLRRGAINRQIDTKAMISILQAA